MVPKHSLFYHCGVTPYVQSYLPHQTRTDLDPFKLFAKMATPGELFSDEILDPFLTSKERTIPLNPNMSIIKVPLSHQYNNKDAA